MIIIAICRFQFHKGTIKTDYPIPELDSIGNFNSIKVRLKLELMVLSILLIRVFQFHKGTIKTAESGKRYSRILNFNSIKVRLKLAYQAD